MRAKLWTSLPSASGDSVVSSRTPSASSRASSAARSFKKRGRETITAPLGGNAPLSATSANAVSRTWPPLTSIKAFLEGSWPHPAIGVEEALAVLPQLFVGADHILDGIDDTFGIETRPEDFAQRRVLRARPAEQDLIILHAFAVDAQYADVADVMVAASIDAARNLDLELAEIVLAFEIGKATGDILRDIDRARIGHVAVIETQAADDVRHQPVVGCGEPERLKPSPEHGKVSLAHVRKDKVLLVRHADFRLTEFVHQICQGVHLVGRAIPRRFAHALQ